jgi:hypothetical protein
LESVVTVMEMQSGVCDRIIDRADEYARAIIQSMGQPVTRDLLQAVSGALLSFLADATVLAEQAAAEPTPP